MIVRRNEAAGLRGLWDQRSLPRLRGGGDVKGLPVKHLKRLVLSASFSLVLGQAMVGLAATAGGIAVLGVTSASAQGVGGTGGGAASNIRGGAGGGLSGGIPQPGLPGTNFTPNVPSSGASGGGGGGPGGGNGGKGGDGFSPVSGALAGGDGGDASNSGIGQNGQDATPGGQNNGNSAGSAGGGGRGGLHGSAAAPTGVVGGIGGNGGTATTSGSFSNSNGTASGGGGGGGGAGGYGWVLTGTSSNVQTTSNITGGNGGAGGTGGVADTSGTTITGGNGGLAAGGFGGNGGDGGVGVYLESPVAGAAFTNSVTMRGGDGGIGGDGGTATASAGAVGAVDGAGGTGGAGGVGLLVDNTTGVAVTINNNATIRGGAGGDGGQGDGFFQTNPSNVADGGAGGHGISGSSLIIVNASGATIAGADGGRGGATTNPSNPLPSNGGAGGDGITGQDLTIYNGGTIQAGAGGAAGTGTGGTAGAAGLPINFTGGTNTLIVTSGSANFFDSTGAATRVAAYSVNDTFGLGGTGTSGSFDVTQLGPAGSSDPNVMFSGFGKFVKVDSGTWALTGAPSGGLPTPWTITGGTLQISSAGSLGTGGLTFAVDSTQPNLTRTLQTTGSSPIIYAESVTMSAAGTFDIGTGANLTLQGAVSGAGALTKDGGGTLILANDNTSYSGDITVNNGNLEVGAVGGMNGGLGSGNVKLTNSTNTLVFNRTDSTPGYGYGGQITGAGGVTQAGSGTTTLTNANGYTGPTQVNAGTLVIATGGSIASAATVNGGALVVNGTTSAGVTVQGGTLRGGGTIGGSVNVTSGALTAQDESGTGASTLTIGGSLTLSSAATVNFNYDVAPATGNLSALQIHVTGPVTLGGAALNVTAPASGNLLPGIYGLIHSDSSSGVSGAFGAATFPTGTFDLQYHKTNGIVTDVNLVNSTGVVMSFWDGGGTPDNGHIEGGSGTWVPSTATTDRSWTDKDGGLNGPYADASFATFMGTGGTVTVAATSPGEINVTGMQFVVDGYTVTGGVLTLLPTPQQGPAPPTPQTIIRVGNGTLGGANTTATIESVLSGSVQLVKADPGTLVLSGNNQYTGGTLVDNGVLQVSSDTNLGAPAGQVILDGGTLRISGTSFNAANTMTRAVSLGAGNGGIDIQELANNFTISSGITGPGALTKLGAGTLTLSGTNSYSGPTAINAGTLQVDGSITSSPVNVNSGGTLSGTGSLGGLVTNYMGGTIAPGDPGSDNFGALTLRGSYVGNGGTLAIQSVLGGDNSPTDQLILDGGSASGSTLVQVQNVGGTGLPQTTNGIPIIVAQNGATTTSGAFKLSGIVAAGAYQYMLFQGPPSGGSGDPNTWYLRNNIPNPNPPNPPNPGPPIPLYRPEVALYSAMAGMARTLTMSTIGTFHERNGDQGLVRGSGTSERAWGRLFGQSSEQGHVGTVNGRFDGHAGGVQSGVDIYRTDPTLGYQSRLGFMGSYGRAQGDVSGFALGVQSAHAGKVNLDAYSVGGYWTQMGIPGWYIDTVVMGTLYDGTGTSTNQIGIRTRGHGFAGSLEAGYPIALGGGVAIEPQAQLVYQHLDLHGTRDRFSSVDFDATHSLAGRLGLRLSLDTMYGATRLRPYLKANVWQDWGDTDRTTFAGAHLIEASFRGTAVEVGGGIAVDLTTNIGLWAAADYTTDVAGDQDREAIRGNLGLRVLW